MREVKVKAIVVGNKDYKEKDMLVTLFTLEKGVVLVTFKGVKNSNAKLKSAKEIFCFGDYIYAEGKMNTIISADIIDTFYSITKNIKNYFSACNILTIIKTILPEGETSPVLFVDSLKCLSMLAENIVSPELVLCKYLIRVFEGFGYKFNLSKCSCCGSDFINHRYMNLLHGDITCYNCRVGQVVEISPAVQQSMRLLSNTDYSLLSTLKLSAKTIEDVLGLLKNNFEFRFNKKLS